MANDLALIFRRNKTEYIWLQNDDFSKLSDSEVEIIGIYGPDVHQPHIIENIVFGGVRKGGILESVLLFKSDVVIRPLMR